MDSEQTTIGEQTRALLAEHGIQVTEEGVARARQKLREADQRMTPEARERVARIFGLEHPAA